LAFSLDFIMPFSFEKRYITARPANSIPNEQFAWDELQSNLCEVIEMLLEDEQTRFELFSY
jgi:hypothetical protein